MQINVALTFIKEVSSCSTWGALQRPPTGQNN